jgi:hypothetical protein
MRTVTTSLLNALRYAWALPTTCLGLLFVLIVWLDRGHICIVQGVVEVYSPLLTRLLDHGLPWVRGIAALTLGHVILGRDGGCLNRSRSHEHVHVRQCERWGPFFIPAYLLASVLAYMKGRDPYWDNWFERQAYGRHY